MNDIFSLKRFAQVFRVHCFSHFFRFLLAFLIFSGLTFGINYLLSTIDSLSGRGVALAINMIIALLTVPFVTSLLASHSFSEYHNRAKATQLLMMPASRLEKYVSLYSIYVLIIPLCFLLTTYFIEAGFMADLARDIQASYGGTAEFEAARDTLERTPFTYDNLMTGNIIDMKAIMLIWFWLACYQSIFFLGSSIFKAVPFLLTCICMIVFSTLLSIIGNIIDSFGDWFGEYVETIFETPENISLILPGIILVVLTALSWLRYRSMKLV